MKNYDLSILIPSRNEMFLNRTVQDILEHKKGKTEILIGLDGQWADPGVEDHLDVKILYYPNSIGQRAITNQLCKLSSAKYVMKVDAHCSFEDGFDVKMLDAFSEAGDNVTMVPIMRNLHAFDWVCPDGHRRYQSPSGPCSVCSLCSLPEFDKKKKPTLCTATTNGIHALCHKDTIRDIVWVGKRSPQSTSYRFDKTLHFQYFGEYKTKQSGDLVESMSLQGSCFMLTREKYWELNICDEGHGSWGQQGTEVACKTWLSGGRVLVNKRTWYAHMFRTQGGDFGFPYPHPASEVDKARAYSQNLFLNGKWDKATHPLSWLLEKFQPVPGWHDELIDKPLNDMEIQEDFPKAEKPLTKGIIFYTDNQLNGKIAHAVQKQLNKISKEKNIPIVSSSLKPMPHFGIKNIHIKAERGYLTMFRQILAALEASDADIIYMCEHDCIYPVEHFDFIPIDKNIFYYNVNVYKLRNDGLALWVEDCAQVSGICGFREELIKHYKERVELVEKNGYPHGLGFEPGARTSFVKKDGTREWLKNKYAREYWKSKVPIIDIRHSSNLTKNRWSPDLFRNKDNCRGWKESYEIPGWGSTKDIIKW